MKKSYLFLLASIVMCISCKANQSKVYVELKQSSNDSNLYSNIYKYEMEHPNHFESKLDLAKLNLFSGNYSETWKYLTRAEGIYKNSKHPKYSNLDISSMYGSFAVLYLLNNDLENAKAYVDKACSIPKFGELYGYLKGRVYFALNDKDTAWSCFEKTYAKYSNEISAEELQSYMYLAAEKEEYVKAKKLLEQYFQVGSFFPGLGLFASGIYEKNNNYQNSVFCAFLDYEYQSCFGNQNDSRFVENLRNALTKAQKDNHDDGAKALKAVLALYTNEKFEIIDTDFFAYKYIYYKYKFKHFKWESKDAQYYLSIEKNMNTFPCYYWMLWQVVESTEEIKDYTNWLPILNKIISLKKSLYTESARKELGRVQGLSEKDSEKILISSEVQSIITNFLLDKDEIILKPIYDFISVKDCEYLYNALSILKNNSNQSALLNKVFSDKAKTSSGRLKDRLEYIIQ